MNITFGKGLTPFDFGPPLPAGTTSLVYKTDKCPANGEYSIIASTSGCFGQWHAASDHTGMKADGTKESPGGYFMCIDAAYAADNFYVQNVDGLCPGTTYEFGAWIVNMFNVGGGSLPNITFTIEKTDGTVLQTYNTGNIPVLIPFAWKQYSFFFVTPANVTSVVLRMRNNAPGGGGNDLGLDDITFRPAGPNIALSAPGGTNNSVAICSGNPSSVDLSAIVDNCYPSTAYQWQETSDNGVTWSDIPGATNITYSLPSSVPGTFLYRLAVAQVGGMGIASCKVFSGTYTVTVGSSVASSVSIVSSSPSGICAGSPVTFTATPVNGGTTPVYQWKLNGANVGTNSVAYTNNSLSNNDAVTCVLTSSLGCQVPVSSNSITMTVNPVVTPAVSIAASSTSICSGNPVTFTATPVNGGAAPPYQWHVNGANTGTNSPSFTTTSLANGDVVTCSLTNSEVCATPATAASNSITMTTTIPAAPAVVISASSNNTCPGVPVTFTAVPTNGGTAPIYQWKVNAVNAGTNSPAFTSNTLANGDVVSCLLTTSEPCIASPTASSNTITVVVNPTITPAVSISESSNNVCAGSSVTFTAVPVNGGTAPVYQWKLNGADVGVNGTTYANNSLSNNDIVSCILTNSAACHAPVSSNNVTMTVNPITRPAVSIAASNNGICAGNPVTFTATAVNGGAAPVYQWQLNGSNTGSNSPSFTSTAMTDGDLVTCQLTNNEVCAIPSTVVSNSITVKSTIPATAAVVISASAGNICPGAPVSFTAVPSHGGTMPVYQWKVNAVNMGGNSTAFTSSTLANGDVISCTLTSNEFCITTSTAVSNNIIMVVNAPVTPTVSIAESNNNVCAGIPVTFTATPGNGGAAPVYQWMVNGANAGTDAAIFTSKALANADVVNCRLLSSLACATPATSNNIAMTINPLPKIVMGPGKVIDKGGGVQLTPVITGDIQSYNWLPPAGLSNSNIGNPFASPLTTTVYKLKAVAVNNCADSASITVKVLIAIIVPNAFSPNGDGINDVWNITGLSDYSGCRVDIFSRYGQAVFHSDGYSRPWDGTKGGKPLPFGEYYYIINPGNGEEKLTGGIMLIR